MSRPLIAVLTVMAFVSFGVWMSWGLGWRGTFLSFEVDILALMWQWQYGKVR